jgi:hypothetical protein
MNQGDDVLAAILWDDAPPRFDPGFRLAVLERRVQQILRRRVISTLLAGLAFGVALVIAMLKSANAVEIGSLLAVGAGLVVSWRFYAPVLAHGMRTVLSMSRHS